MEEESTKESDSVSSLLSSTLDPLPYWGHFVRFSKSRDTIFKLVFRDPLALSWFPNSQTVSEKLLGLPGTETLFDS